MKGNRYYYYYVLHIDSIPIIHLVCKAGMDPWIDRSIGYIIASARVSKPKKSSGSIRINNLAAEAAAASRVGAQPVITY